MAKMDIPRNEDGTWKQGVSGNPNGRPQEGRAKSFAILDKICAESETQAEFETILRTRLKENPLEFYREFVVALSPKQVNVADITKIPTITEEYFEALVSTVPLKPNDE